ncbi:hypothetical protein [Paenibacillus sp. 7541]|uniref:hypothetical protein n=1 Tax=Paenibacillus sp. 7541 TaxID=2026236 RepID=UPI000BA78922|nr:hypothetical protein [Paenibacillus sp. 7541]PAK48153.1 hypothetical protein CHH75_22925 [Paenibacillus sp. 7541]
MKAKMLCVTALILGLLFISVHHLGYPLGYDLFTGVGIPPLITAGNTTYHLSTIIGSLLLIIGVYGTARLFEARYPKIMSRLIIGCIAYILVFPWVSGQIVSLVKYNTSGISSVAYSTKDSECRFQTIESRLVADCMLNIYNYGNEHQITIRPVDIGFGREHVTLEPKEITVEPHRRSLVPVRFQSVNLVDVEGRGMKKHPAVEIGLHDHWKVYRYPG